MAAAALYLLVFTGGMTIMATEMSASRLLAPFFGNSLFIWANLIGLILVYLTVGYFLGGRLADRRPEPGLLYHIALAAAVMIAVLPFIARPVMGLAIEGIAQVSAGAFLGSFAVTILLFALPVTMLGMISPFAIRLRVTGVETAGNIAGGMYALSTIGSIIGTFLPVLLLIPWLGTRNTMLLFAAALAAAAVLGLATGGGSRLYGSAPLLIAAALLVPQGAIKPDPLTIFETESPYHYIQVVERDGTRYLKLNEGWAVHSVYDPDEMLTGAYWDYFLLAPWFGSGQPPRRVLNIGSAGGTIASELIHYYPGVSVDGVEIDPDVVRAGRDFFAMDDPRLTVHVADGRPFLRTSDDSYDLIAVDAYRQPYIPFYLTTQEFFREVADHLDEDGTVMINVGKVPGDDALAGAIAATMRSVFPVVYSFPGGIYNQMVVATRSPSRPEDLGSRTGTMPTDVAGLASRALAEMDVVEPGGVILTDDRAPVEWLTDQMIIHYAREQ
jgi:spermidine synthase